MTKPKHRQHAKALGSLEDMVTMLCVLKVRQTLGPLELLFAPWALGRHGMCNDTDVSYPDLTLAGEKPHIPGLSTTAFCLVSKVSSVAVSVL